MPTDQCFLVTGATGRLGCEICRRLEDLGARVLPLVLPGYPSQPKRVPWTAHTAPLVVNGPADLAALPSPDYVLNLHWQVSRALPFTAQLLYETDNNLHQLAFLWEWLATQAPARFVNLSSIKVFSHLNRNPISAATEARALSPYGIVKLAAEAFFDSQLRSANTDVVHLRLSSVAAYGEHPSQLMSQLYASAFQRQAIRVNVGHSTALLYVEEAADLIISAALNAQERRYLVTPDSLPNDVIARCFEQAAGRTLRAEYVNLAPGILDPVFISDIPKLAVDWVRRVSLTNMIARLIKQHQQFSLST